jgi:hypothetical protein
VQFPQEQAPVSESLARAIITLANGFLKGDAQAVKSVMERPTASITDELLASGGWEEGTAKIEGIRVVFVSDEAKTSESPDIASFVLAIQEPGAAYVLSWAGRANNNAWTFRSMPSTGATKPRASAWDNRPEAEYADAGAFTFNAAASADDLAAMMENLTPEQRQQLEEAIRQNPDIIKRTPHGPVTIPNPGRAPGGG